MSLLRAKRGARLALTLFQEASGRLQATIDGAMPGGESYRRGLERWGIRWVSGPEGGCFSVQDKAVAEALTKSLPCRDLSGRWMPASEALEIVQACPANMVGLPRKGGDHAVD